MSETVFFATDGEGVLRRWHPDPSDPAATGLISHCRKMERAITGYPSATSTAELLRFLAERLVNVHGENKNLDYVQLAHERAIKLENSTHTAPVIKKDETDE